METPEFPPNSEISKRRQTEEKNVTRITSGEPVRKKKSLRRRFSESFVGGDLKTAAQYTVLEVLLPAARDMIVETISEGFQKLMYGDSRRGRGSTSPLSGPMGYVQYNRMGSSRTSGPQRAISRQARARHDFDEVILESRSEAEEVIDRLFDLVSRYESATVADLYELVGLTSSHTDHKWGWTDLHGAGVSRIRGGYLLDLPEPRPLD